MCICIRLSTRDATWSSLASPGNRYYRRATASTPSGKTGNGLIGDNGDIGVNIAVCRFHRSKIFLKGSRSNRGFQASTMYTPLIGRAIPFPSSSKRKCSIYATRWCAYRKHAFPLSSQVLVNESITSGWTRTISAQTSMKPRRNDFHMAIKFMA